MFAEANHHQEGTGENHQALNNFDTEPKCNDSDLGAEKTYNEERYVAYSLIKNVLSTRRPL